MQNLFLSGQGEVFVVYPAPGLCAYQPRQAGFCLAGCQRRSCHQHRAPGFVYQIQPEVDGNAVNLQEKQNIFVISR
jgi:hypothetical protein